MQRTSFFRSTDRRPWGRLAIAAGLAGAVSACVLVASASADPAAAAAGVASCSPDDESKGCIELREELAEQRLEDMIQQPDPATSSGAAGNAAAPRVGRFPQIRVPLDTPEDPDDLDDVDVQADEVEVVPNPPPVSADTGPPPVDAGERGLDPLIE